MRRAAILETIRRERGISTGRLRLLCGLSWGTLTYHLARLGDAGQVMILPEGRHKYVFPAGETQPAPRMEDAALACAAARGIATAIVRAPGIGISEAAKSAGVTQRMSYYHANALVRAGLVRPLGRRKYDALFPSPALEPLLQSYQMAPTARGANAPADEPHVARHGASEAALPSHG